MTDSNDIANMQSDHLQRFIFDDVQVRGEWVHLNKTWQEVISRREYPAPVQRMLGEMMSAAALLAATVKMDGRLVLQTKSTGPVSVLMVECTSANTLRAFAQWDDEAILDDDAELMTLTGEGTLAITIEMNGAAKPYQGIVSLAGDSMAGLLETYFNQSEQLATRVWLSSDENVSAGLLIQQLPNAVKEDQTEQEAWSRINHLASTVTDNELLTLPAETLLRRLFHEENCRLLTVTALMFACNCSRQRVANTIGLLGEEDATALVEEQGQVEVACEFCNEHYYFDKADVAMIFAHAGSSTLFDSSTIH